jgi:mono/diheme cytochrome c family protein
VLLALETTNKVALAVAAILFISFALIAAFVLPRRSGDFPGEKGVKPFVVASLALFVIMMGTVFVFAKEDHSASPGAETAHGAEEGGEVVGTVTEGDGDEEEAPAEGDGLAGDAANGEDLFASLGCSGCHALDESVRGGPGLGGLYGGEQTLADGSTVPADEAYLIESIREPDAKIVEGYSEGVMSSVIKPGQVSEQDAADLAAFIAQQ